MSNKNHEINETKLARRKDTYRVQTQTKNRRQKLRFALFQTFMSDKQPATWEKIRDKPYDGVVDELVRAFKIMFDRDPKILAELKQFAKQNICEENLLKEAYGIINSEFRQR
jgi:hypothetical protein